MNESKILLIGFGMIGQAIHSLLKLNGYSNIFVLDSRANPSHIETSGYHQIDMNDHEETLRICRDMDIIISALPFHLNTRIVDIASELRKPYFDLTEDISVTRYLERIAKNAKSFYMPHCGLAPGAINVIANHIAGHFKEVRNLELRVGALPLNASNEMKYYLSWSTSGLLNEYIENCEIIWQGEKIRVPALEGLQEVIIDGVKYECFNTSGGVGTLADSLAGKVRNLSYKTIRYPGHRDKIKFLLDDLFLRENPELLRTIFDQGVPINMNDVVILYVAGVGIDLDGRLTRVSYSKKIYPQHGLSAIQIATASALVSMVNLFLTEKLPGEGFIKQEEVSFDEFVTGSGEIFAEKICSEYACADR
jgi:saccharopine dehydrogenase-like NADP-dependent oxidoreductase